MYDFDFFVIGGGSGGVRAARKASEYGAKVGLAESHKVGGTCVIRGCVPKKLFVYASHFAEEFEQAAGYGWTLGGKPTFDWRTLVANKDREIDRLNGLYLKTLENHQVTVFDEHAKLKDAHTIDLGSQTVTADKILIAVGGWPVMPNVPGVEHGISSNEAFYLEEFPERIAVVGGGYIAVEFAGIFQNLGSQVSLLYRGDKILRGFDDDIRHALADEMVKKGMDVRCGVNVTNIEKGEDGLTLTLDDGGTMKVDQIMFATGRAPRTDGLGLGSVGVELSDNGAIKVDEYSRTSIDNIYAVGDVTDRMALTPVAIKEGAAVAANLFHGGDLTVDYDNIATAVFSQPNVAVVGLTEAEARQKCGKVDIYKSGFRPMKNTLGGSDERAFMKLVVDAKSDRVVGAHMMGPEAGEIIQGVAIAIKCGATKAQFDATMAIHPTAAEEFVTMAAKVPEPEAKAAE